MLHSQGTAATGQASRYISQLCKHWSHRFEVRFDAQTGDISLPIGKCRLEAKVDTLNIRAQAADQEALTRLQQVIAEHLERFAFREPFQIAWSCPDGCYPTVEAPESFSVSASGGKAT